MPQATVQFEYHDGNYNLAKTVREVVRVEVVTQLEPDWPLYEGDILLRILHSHPLTNHGTTIIIAFDRQQAESLIDQLLRGL